MKQDHTKYSIGHVLIKVSSLPEAVEDFRRLGFQVTYGTVPEKAANAMIYFDGGSFIELFCTSFNKVVDSLLGGVLWLMSLKDKAFADRYRNYLSLPEGFKDYALDSVPPHSFEENMRELAAKGILLSKPKRMKRTNAEGIGLKWSLCHTPQWQQPFFMSEYQPRLSMEEESYAHGNGAKHIGRLVVSTAHWERELIFYEALLGCKPETKGEKGSRHGSFRLGRTELLLQEGVKDGIKTLVLKGGPRARTGVLDSCCSHGAEIRIEAEIQ